MDNIELPRNSCQADFTINDDNNNDVDAYVDDELVVVSVDAAELTNIVGDNGIFFCQH